MKPPKPPQKPPSNNPPGNQPPAPQGKGDGKGTGYAGYSTYGDYGTYGYGSGQGYGSGPGYGTGYGGYGYGGPGGYGGQGGYGGYSGYYYGYGYGYGGNQAGGEPTQSRNIRDYLVILRERIWYLLLTFFVIFGAFILYLVNATAVYSATGSMQVLKAPSGVSTSITGGVDSTQLVADSTDFNTRIRLMETRDVAERVANMMTDDEKKAFLAPYKGNNPLAPETPLPERLLRSRSVTTGRQAYIIQVSVEHPNAALAAKVADYFLQAFIDYNAALNVDKASRSVETLVENRRQQSAKVADLQKQMSDLIDKYGKQNLQKDSNILPAELTQFNANKDNDQSIVDQIGIKWKQVQQYRDEKKSLTDLSFISSDTHVSTLLSSLADVDVSLSEMQHKFGPNHPDVQQATQKQAQIKAELDDAVGKAAERIHTDYLAAQEKYTRDNDEVNKVLDDMHSLGAAQTQYDSLANDKDIAEAMLKEMELEITQHTFKVEDNSELYQIVDPAAGMVQQTQPKTLLLIVGGLISGIMGGVGMAFLVAFLDDRIKSAFDIESYVGLPLIGILPRIAHLNANEKAQAVTSNADRRITEAFRSIYSSLKLNEASKNAHVILVTSTIPSEGKSFMTTNLALTYAMHAERVLLIDCDLRMPNVAKSLGRTTNEQGLMTHLREGRPFEECVVKDFYPGLDVLPTGGRTNNPTQIFNSKEFADFIVRMRQQYDRVFIDSPPLGAVSDALNLLPNVDGVLYVIKFNTVKRKVAKINLSRLMQGNVPVFGAILNQISLTSASYYYTHYYDKSYRNYYMHADETQAEDDKTAADATAATSPQPEGQTPPPEQEKS